MQVPKPLGAFFIAWVLASAVAARTGSAQAPSSPAPTAGPQSHGHLGQVMQGILFPASNVIFFVQTRNPAEVTRDDDPSMATNTLTGIYGGWQAVENSGIALAEAANLLMIPGRACSNGRPVPLGDSDWGTFVQGLRDAGMAAQKAAAERNTDAFLDVSDRVATACANCHDMYREKTAAQGGTAARCTK